MRTIPRSGLGMRGLAGTPVRSGSVLQTLGNDQYLLGSNNSRNDEFRGGSTIDGKWTLVGTTPDVVDVNSTTPDNLFLRRNDTAGQLTCYYQSLPTLPCDVVLKVSSDNVSANFARGGGLLLLPASPTTASRGIYLGTNWNSGRLIAGLIYTNLSTYGGQPFTYSAIGSGSVWLRATVRAGGTAADFYVALDNHGWVLLGSNYSLGMTAVNIGIAMSPEGQAADLLSSFDFFRVST